jgi:hypothetical protein
MQINITAKHISDTSIYSLHTVYLYLASKLLRNNTNNGLISEIINEVKR